MTAAIDKLFEIVRSAGGTVTLYGTPVTARELESFAWSGFVERHADKVIEAAARAIVVKAEPRWSDYP